MKESMKLVLSVIKWILIGVIVLFIMFVLFCEIQEMIYKRKGPLYEPKYSVYTIASNSMKPKISKYDVVINEKIDNIENVEVGDVITFISTSLDHSGITVTHRVVDITKDEKNRLCFVTKGDANDDEDKACARGGNVIGKVVLVVPFVGFIGTLPGIIIFILIIVLYIIYKKKIRGKNEKINR